MPHHRISFLAAFCLLFTPLICFAADTSKPATAPAANPWGVKQVLVGEPNQPHVLLIGDSILNGYNGQAAELLRGKVNLDAFVTPKHIGGIGGDLKGILGAKSYDVIFFNDIGLHAWQPGRIPDGKYEPLMHAHIANLRALAPKAKLIFATTTPILTKTKPYALDAEKNAIVIERNNIATKIMKAEQIPVADFYAALSTTLDQSAGDAFHWTKPAYARIAGLAAERIAEALGISLPATRPSRPAK